MHLRSTLCVCVLAVCAAAGARAQTPFYAVSQDDFYQTVTNAVVYERPIIDNAIRKTGAGTLTLQNPRMTRAALEVLQGGVAISLTNAFVPPGLPAALQQKAAFWVDANTNVVADGDGRVSRWHDVREASVSGPYLYMMATNTEVARQPFLVTDAGLGGKRYLDFGTWGAQDTNTNSMWLFWTDTNGVAKTLDLRSAFIVFGSHNGALGGSICLIQNTVNLAVPSAPFAGAQTLLWASSSNVLADDGVNYLDRQMRDGRNIQIFDKAYHLIETLTLQNAKANDFAKDRIYPGYSGGSRICEAVFFTAELTEAERLQVQDYLWHKWFSRSEASLGTFQMANASALDFAVGTNDAQATVAGTGAVSKSGNGTLTLLNAGTDAFDGTVRLRGGSLLVAGEPFLFELEEGGQAIYAQDLNISRTAADAGKVVKTGGGEWALASVTAGVSEIEVAAGALRLATPRAAAAVPVAEGAVNDGSLESFIPDVLASGSVWVAGLNRVYKHYLNTTAYGWSFTQVVAVVGSGFHAGVALDYTNGLMTVDSAPDGDAVIYLNRGQAETGFTVSEAGVYRLSFQAAGRVNNLNRHIVISIDGTPVRTISTLTTAFWKFDIVLPYMTAGAHKVSFRGEGIDSSKASFIDAVRLVPVTLCAEAPVLATVTNASFEEPVELYETAAVTNEPAGTGWTFSGLAGMGRIQSLNSTPRSMPMVMPEGIGAAFVPTNGSLRTTVTFPTSGVYRLTFSLAARQGQVNHKFNVLLGGKLVRPFQTTDTAFQRVALTLPPVATGEQLELAFEGKGTSNTASLIDDIRIERIGADLAVDALKNGGFEAVTSANPLVTTNWLCTSLAGVATNNNPWSESVPYGTYMGYTSMIHSFSQTVTFAESGNYALRFITKTRAAYPLPQYHDFEVRFGGQRVGRILNMGDALRSYELPLPPVTAGVPYTLQFKGLQTYAATLLSMYDGIAIVPAPAARPRQSVLGRFPETTALDIATGAKLALDFDGEIKVRDVRYAGHVVSGTIDAATHPEFVSGTGRILSPAKGTMITVQ